MARLWLNKQYAQEKQMLETRDMSRTWTELGRGCPAGPAGTRVTPGVRDWSLIVLQLFIKARRLDQEGWEESSVLRRRREPAAWCYQ